MAGGCTAGHCCWQSADGGSPHCRPSRVSDCAGGPGNSAQERGHVRASAQSRSRLSGRTGSAPAARRYVPVTTATCGPPYCCVQVLGGPGTGKKIPSPKRSTAATAPAGSGSVRFGRGRPAGRTSGKDRAPDPRAPRSGDGQVEVGRAGCRAASSLPSSVRGRGPVEERGASSGSSRVRSTCASAEKARWCSTYAALPSAVSIGIGG